MTPKQLLNIIKQSFKLTKVKKFDLITGQQYLTVFASSNFIYNIYNN